MANPSFPIGSAKVVSFYKFANFLGKIYEFYFQELLHRLSLERGCKGKQFFLNLQTVFEIFLKFFEIRRRKMLCEEQLHPCLLLNSE